MSCFSLIYTLGRSQEEKAHSHIFFAFFGLFVGRKTAFFSLTNSVSIGLESRSSLHGDIDRFIW